MNPRMPAENLFQGDSNAPGTDAFLEAADRIGVDLVRDAIWSGRQCNWLGWIMKPLDGFFQPAYCALPSSLYDGVAGIALFLAYLHRHTGDRHQEATLRGAIRQMQESAEAWDMHGAPGYFSGLMGIGYSIVDVGELLGSQELIENGLRHVAAAAGRETNPPMYDVIAGAAGMIPGLLDLAARFGRDEFVEYAERQGRLIVKAAYKSDKGISWPQPLPELKHLLGFSHGTSGIAWALLELYRVRPNPSYLENALGALEYERYHFNATENNWPDLREQPGNPQAAPGYPVAWCHGATGIGLSRLRILDLLGHNERVFSELDAALRRVSQEVATPKRPEQGDFSYCHGMAGNAEFLLLVAEQLGRDDIQQAVVNIGRFGISQYQARGLPWPCGVPGAPESLGLMLGTAGVGHFFLRLHDPVQTPSILILKPKSSERPLDINTSEQSRGIGNFQPERAVQA